MSKLFFLISVGVVVCAAPALGAEGSRLPFDELESGLLSIRNPFESQLPKKEETLPETKPPVTPEPAVRQPPREPQRPRPARPAPVVTPPKTPQRKPEAKETPMPHFAVTGIVWNTDRPQAIINGRIVNIGDTISEIEIKDIRQSGIDVLFQGETVTIKPGAPHEQ